MKNGYSRKIVVENINSALRVGVPKNAAIRDAFNHARRCFFARYPGGVLPAWLAWPKQNRLSRHYRNGVPVIGSNPVRELPTPPGKLARIRHAIKAQTKGLGQDTAKAAMLYTDFTGHEDIDGWPIEIPDMPKALLHVGKIDGILYSTVRDGEPENYIHEFKKHARPEFCVSPDGKQIFIIGGNFRFTERGIVDNPKK